MSLRQNQVYVVIEESRLPTGKSPGGLRPEVAAAEKEGFGREGLKQGLGAEKLSNASLIFDNPLFAHDPGLARAFSKDRAMDPASNWGEQGGADEAPTRPKLLAGASSRSASTRSRMPEIGFEVPENGNWHGEEKEGLTDLDGLLEGEVDMEDDDVLVLEEEEEEQPPEVQQRWRLMGRYISQRKPNIDDMTEHFNVKVWRLRTGVNFAPMGKNWFKITLYSQGDFNFMSQGGPWIYREERYCNVDWGKLGKYLEADLDAEGNSPYDFLRVRVEIPIDRRLQQSITTQVKGKEETNTFLLRYERVPYFCFWRGFIGHDDTECEKKRIGIPSLQYDSRLRCSPVRKFECRHAYGPPQQHPHVRKGLNFSSSDENSATLGTPTDRRRNSHVVRHTGNHIPTRVDAWDGFEEQEKEGSVEVDNELANKINHMNLPLVRVGEGLGMVKRHKKSAVRTSHSRGTSRGAGRSAEAEKQLPDVIENLIPIAMYPAFPSASYLAGLGSEEMIPPLRGLSSFVFSAGDTLMSDADSILGKRGPDQQEGDSEDRSKAPGYESEAAVEGLLKKGRRERSMSGQGGKESDLEATSFGAAGQLTGSQGVARQGQ
ncbi:hypothetical protein ACQ4PT_071665 [Festuca glaucescens]